MAVRRSKPEARVTPRVRRTLTELGYVEGVDFLYEVEIRYGTGRLYADAVLYDGDVPLAVIEAEGHASALRTGFEEARLKAVAFHPEDPVPLLWVAAGKQNQCYLAQPPEHQLGIRYEPVEAPPERLFHPDALLAHIQAYLQRQGAASGAELRYREQLYQAFRQLAGDAHQRCQQVVNALLPAPSAKPPRRQPKPLKAIAELLTSAMRSGSNFELAYALRWLMRPYFRPAAKGKQDPVRQLGRYLTPMKVIRLMVDAVDPQPNETVLDFACGTGGFLLQTARRLTERHAASPQAIAANLHGYDYDSTCVRLAQASLALGLGIEFSHLPQVRQWNSLQPPLADAFDIVISNPPAGEIPKGMLPENWELPMALPNLYEAVFLVRAVQLTRAGGRIGLILPEGLLAGARFRRLREWLVEQAHVRKVISLPRRLFPFTPSKMSAILMEKRSDSSRGRGALFAALEGTISAAG